MGSLSSEAEEERETQREKMCVRFTLIIANSLLALLGLLLLAGGVWRIVDDELEGGGQRDQGHPRVGRGEEGGGRVGGGCEGGCQLQVLQLRSPRHGGSYPTRRPLRFLWGEEGEPVPFEPLQHLRLHHPPPPDRRHRVHQC